MWQTKIVNYEYLFVYMTRHIFVACIYSHVCQALCDYNVALKTIFVVSSTRAIVISEASPTIWSCYANLNHYHYSLEIDYFYSL